MLKGIDIAFPDQPDPLAVSSLTAEGVSFVVQRVTQGVYSNDDPVASARIKDVQDAGLIGGAYHVLTRVEDASGDPVPWNSGVAQCNAFVAALPGSSPEGLLCMVEWDADDGGPFTFQDQRFEPVPRGATRQELRDFVRRWFALFPTHPLFLCTRESYAVPRSEGLDIKALNPRLFLWDANRVNGGTPPLGRDIDDAQVAAFEAEVAAQGRAGLVDEATAASPGPPSGRSADSGSRATTTGGRSTATSSTGRGRASRPSRSAVSAWASHRCRSAASRRSTTND